MCSMVSWKGGACSPNFDQGGVAPPVSLHCSCSHKGWIPDSRTKFPEKFLVGWPKTTLRAFRVPYGGQFVLKVVKFTKSKRQNLLLRFHQFEPRIQSGDILGSIQLAVFFTFNICPLFSVGPQFRSNPHWTPAHTFAGNSFDVACIQCEDLHLHQQVPFACVAPARPVWIGRYISRASQPKTTPSMNRAGITGLNGLPGLGRPHRFHTKRAWPRP